MNTVIYDATLQHVSLVIAEHNGSDIVIGSDGLSYKTAGNVRSADTSIQKINSINSKLALMITGTYVNDKLEFIRLYKRAMEEVYDIDKAFDELYKSGRGMTIHPKESFRIGLAGYSSGKPTFKLIEQIYGEEMGYVKDYPFYYYLSGDQGPVQLAEESIKPANQSISAMTVQVEEILKKCIKKYPKVLGEPISFITLSADDN